MFKRIAMGFLAALGLASMASATPANAKDHQRTAIESRSVAKPGTNWARRMDGIQRALPSGGVRRFLNQRQYRKKVRSNPSLLRSKKHRSKN